MIWIKAKDGDVCEDCGGEFAGGEDVFQHSTKDLLCEGCKEDRDIDDEDNRGFEESDYLIDGVGFADPGGVSSLRAETKNNPRNLPCKECERENVLTALDVAAGYVCDYCANQAECGY